MHRSNLHLPVMTFGSQIQAAEMTFLHRAVEDVRHPEGWRFSSCVPLGGDLWVDPELTRGTMSHLTLASPGLIGHHASHGVRGV